MIKLDITTIGFFVIMVICAFRYVKQLKKNPSYESYIPEAIAALGILGTFIGITIGLLNFNEANLDESITGLLGGMKTAFITSLLGLSISTVLKMWSQSKKRKFFEKEESVEEKLGQLIQIMKSSDNSTIATAISELTESSKVTNKTMVEGMKSMEKSIISLTSEDENSLIKQMTKLRTGMINAQDEAQERLNTGLKDMGIQLGHLVKSNNAISTEIENGNKELISHFRGFRDEMAKAFTEEFTMALTRSIEDLNAQLQEQLGENFKNAINKLVDWQEHYIETIKSATQVLDKTMEAIQSTDKAMENISKRSDSLIKVSEKLVPTIKGLNTIQNDLALGMNNMSQASDEFKEKVPQLLKSSEDLSNLAFNKINKTLDGLGEFANEFENLTINIIENIDNSTENLHKNIEKSIQSTIDNSNFMTETATAQVNNIEEVNQKIATSYEQIIAELSERLKDLFEKSNGAMNDSIAKLEEGLENNLENSLNSLVGALSKVSEKFVDDYEPLTIELKKLVSLAKGAR